MFMPINSASVVADQSMAAFLCRKPAFSAAAGDGCVAICSVASSYYHVEMYE